MASNRYAIVENLGCLPALYPSPLVVALKDGPSLIIATAGFVFACTPLSTRHLVSCSLTLSFPGMAARNVIRYRANGTAAELLCTSQPALTTSRCIRLLLLCAIAGLWPLLSILLCMRHLSAQFAYWPGWAVARQHFGVPLKIPLSVQPPAVRQPFTLDVSSNILSAYLAFVILVCTDGVRNDISKVWDLFVRKVSCLHCCSCYRKTLAKSLKQDESSSTDQGEKLRSAGGADREIVNETQLRDVPACQNLQEPDSTVSSESHVPVGLDIV